MVVVFSLLSSCVCVVDADGEDSTLLTLSRQLMSNQLSTAERVRYSGQSGIQQLRVRDWGTRNYYAPSESGPRIAGFHNHPHGMYSLGAGEFSAVLNGVAFRTRHNDYVLRQPFPTKDFHKTKPIDFPEVPPEVLEYTELEDQMAEMKEWFKAWQDGSTSPRDYRQYFKPVLCYMEGAWMYADQSELDGFFSDRHAIEAKDWLDLEDKVRYEMNSGTKSENENLAFLPVTVAEIENDSPVLAQWNYRILCHPLSKDVPINRFRPIDDLKMRMASRMTYEDYINSEAVRFQVNPRDSHRFQDVVMRKGLLDELMGEIPGKDNYEADLRDEADTLRYDFPTEEPLNAGYYHRFYGLKVDGQSHVTQRPRGYSDPTLFWAMTSHPSVVPTYFKKCDENDVCEQVPQRWTYAFPIEILYLTPLHSWNPHNIPIRDWQEASTVTAGGRNGKTPEKAFDGCSQGAFYLTPSEFYGEAEESGDPADTKDEPMYVLNSAGETVITRASGVRVHLPDISGLGKIRQRYAIMPVHEEGSGTRKELEALKDLVLQPRKYSHMIREDPVDFSGGGGSASAAAGGGENTTLAVENKITKSYIARIVWGAADHFHWLYISKEAMMKLDREEQVWILSEPDGKHGNHIHNALVERITKPNGWTYLQAAEITNMHEKAHGSRVQIVTDPVA